MRAPIFVLSALLLAGCTPPPIAYQPTLFNTRPVAVIDAEATAPLLGAVALDGTASYDPDGDPISWSWRIHAAPDDSALPANPFDRNGDRNASLSSFVPDVVGRYTIALQVNDGQLTSESAHVVVDVVPDGEPPQADAGFDGAGLEGSEVCVDGSGSIDPLGGALAWSWTLAARPDTSTLTTSDLTATDAEACFVPDAPGLFTLALVVSSGGRTSAPDYVDVTIGSTNQPPLAAFEALNEDSCAFVALDGSASVDPDGDALSHRWHLLLRPPGSQTPLGTDAFDDATSATPTFYADTEGEYVVQLAVFDGESWSEPAFVTLTTTEKLVNTPPMVGHQGDIYYGEAPSPCQSACVTKVAALDASATFDPDEDPLEVTWEVVSGPGQLAADSGLTVDLQIPGPPGTCSWGQTNESTTIVRVSATDCSGDVDTSQIVILYSCGPGL